MKRDTVMTFFRYRGEYGLVYDVRFLWVPNVYGQFVSVKGNGEVDVQRCFDGNRSMVWLAIPIPDEVRRIFKKADEAASAGGFVLMSPFHGTCLALDPEHCIPCHSADPRQFLIV